MSGCEWSEARRAQQDYQGDERGPGVTRSTKNRCRIPCNINSKKLNLFNLNFSKPQKYLEYSLLTEVRFFSISRNGRLPATLPEPIKRARDKDLRGFAGEGNVVERSERYASGAKPEEPRDTKRRVRAGLLCAGFGSQPITLFFFSCRTPGGRGTKII